MHSSSMRNFWRLRFAEWLEARYPNFQIELINPVCDEDGNNFSGIPVRMPKELRERNKRHLELASMRNISEVR